MRKLIATLFFTAFAACMPPVLAADEPGFYLGGAIGQMSLDDDGVCALMTSCETEDTGFKLFGGYRFNRNFALEAGYANLGETRAAHIAIGNETDEITTLLFDVVGVLPLNEQFSLFGKIGVHAWQVEQSGTIFGMPFSDSADGTDLTFGLGAQYDFNEKLGIRAEWERFDVDNTDVDLLSAGVVFRF